MRWLLLCALGACLSIPFATIAAVAVAKPVDWVTWVVIFILIVPLSVVAYFIHKTLSAMQKKQMVHMIKNIRGGLIGKIKC